jgi:hypothetical protein
MRAGWSPPLRQTRRGDVRSRNFGLLGRSPEAWETRSTRSWTFASLRSRSSASLRPRRPQQRRKAHGTVPRRQAPRAFVRARRLPEGQDRDAPAYEAIRRSAFGPALERSHRPFRRDMPSLRQGFLASMVWARSSMRGRPFFAGGLTPQGPIVSISLSLYRGISPLAFHDSINRIKGFAKSSGNIYL